MTRQRGAWPVFTSLGAMLIAVAALAQSVDETLAQSPDELVPLIQENIEDIELEIRVDPARAEENLARQRERLETVRIETPDHPMLSSLERRIDELGEEIAAARQSGAGSAVEEEQFVPLSVPADVRVQLRDVKELQTLGDREMMLGRMEIAAQHLDESETLIETIEEEYGDQIPPGYAALIVAKERLAALREQLERQQSQ